MGEEAEKAMGLLLNLCHLLFLPNSCPGFDKQGVTQEKMELACGWQWASVHTHVLLLLYMDSRL